METNRNPGEVMLHKKTFDRKREISVNIATYVSGIIALFILWPLGVFLILCSVVGTILLKSNWNNYVTIYENAVDVDGKWLYFEDVESTQIWYKDETDAEGNGSVNYYIEVFMKNGRRTTIDCVKELSDEFNRRGLMLPGMREIK